MKKDQNIMVFPNYCCRETKCIMFPNTILETFFKMNSRKKRSKNESHAFCPRYR